MSNDITPKTLYIGNLDHAVSESLLCALFSHIGTINNCKIIRETIVAIYMIRYHGWNADRDKPVSLS
ncbi:hypothetical protein CAJAP_01014 [Camponotus japonicus]